MAMMREINTQRSLPGFFLLPKHLVEVPLKNLVSVPPAAHGENSAEYLFSPARPLHGK